MKRLYAYLTILALALLLGYAVAPERYAEAYQYLPWYEDAGVQTLTVETKLVNQGDMQLKTITNATLRGASYVYAPGSDNGTMFFCSDCAAGKPGLVYGNGTSWAVSNGTAPFVPRTTSS